MLPAIRALLYRDGPLPLARVMALAADHYYASAEPFGSDGDFVTAPEISQMFGELLGLWLADLWVRAGQPAPVLLVELGPGRGTLMTDARRAIARAAPALADAHRLHLVEKSRRLRAIQAERLPDAHWHDRLEDVPDGMPMLLVANEFLDALPISQFVRTVKGWALRRVGAEGWDDTLPANAAFLPEALADAPAGAIHERNFAGEALMAQLARRLAADGGAALFVDYGYRGPALGDTLQAIHQRQPADPRQCWGEADISAHVDFAAMAAAARAAADVRPWGPVPQGGFLDTLGLGQRAEALKRGQSVTARAGIEAARVRLASQGGMGRLFQALAITHPLWPAPAGFPMMAP